MTVLPLVAALAWTVALIVDEEPLGPAGALLVGVGLLVTATVSVVGMTVTGGRWAHRLAFVSAAAGLTLALIRPIDALWIIATGASVIAGATLFLPQTTRRIRKLPAATGPPGSTVLLTAILLTTPFLLGIVSGGSTSWAILVVGLTAPVFAFLFVRVVPGGLLGVRLVWPLLALGLTAVLSFPAAVVAVITALGVAVLAWRPDVKASFHPPRETGTTYAIPPELTPREVLDAARLDDQGRTR